MKAGYYSCLASYVNVFYTKKDASSHLFANLQQIPRKTPIITLKSRFFKERD
jgi:hypothetical protein